MSERLTKFVKPYTGLCSCGGWVKVNRDSTTYQLQMDKCWCLKCGKRYFVHEVDYEKFIGIHPSFENL